MKKTLLIILALVLVIVGGIWTYLMLFGAPESGDEIFTDLGLGGGEAPNTFEQPVDNNVPDNNTDETAIDTTKALNLLVVDPVAGGIIVGTSTENQKVRYVEKRNGQIHEINLSSNQRTTLRSEEIGFIKEAVWSKDGNLVVVVSGDTQVNQVELLSWEENEDDASSTPQFVSTALPPDAYNFGFSSASDELYFLRSDNEGSIAYAYDVNATDAVVWFSVPFIEPAVHWAKEPIVYNKPGEGFDGFAYRLVNGSLRAIGTGGEALVAEYVSATSTVISFNTESGFDGFSYTADNDYLPSNVAIPALPEKCVTKGVGSDTLYCGYPINPAGYLPNDWYKGKTIMEDLLWSLDLVSGSAVTLANLTEESGQVIDVTDMKIDETGTKVLFRNKGVNSLWLYDLTVR